MNMKSVLREIIRHLLRKVLDCHYNLEDVPSVKSQSVIVDAVNDALRFVPYYMKYPSSIENLEQIKQLPILTKYDILCAKDKDFVSRKVARFMISQIETGGTSGVSLRVYRTIKEIKHYQEVANFAFSIIGKNLNVAVLRGDKPENGELFQHVGPSLVLSSYQLSETNLDYYLTALKDNDISCIHAYPSAIVILARLIKNKYGCFILPGLKGILTSSEIFAVEDKKLVKEVFGGVKIVDFYGLNELCCAAVAVDFEPFHFFQDYGYVEFVDTGRKTTSGHKISQIIATSVMNKTMPLIRYSTEDYVELNENGEVLSIIGRSSDFLVNAHHQLIPCIFLNRDISFRHVTNFQFYQDAPGYMTFRVVVDNDFGSEDEKYLLEDLKQSFVDVSPRVEVVESIKKTRIGKQLRLVQLLNLKDFQ